MFEDIFLPKGNLKKFEGGQEITHADIVSLSQDLDTVLYNYAFLCTIHQGLNEKQGLSLKEDVKTLLKDCIDTLDKSVDTYWEEMNIPSNVISFPR